MATAPQEPCPEMHICEGQWSPSGQCNQVWSVARNSQGCLPLLHVCETSWSPSSHHPLLEFVASDAQGSCQLLAVPEETCSASSKGGLDNLHTEKLQKREFCTEINWTKLVPSSPSELAKLSRNDQDAMRSAVMQWFSQLGERLRVSLIPNCKHRWLM